VNAAAPWGSFLGAEAAAAAALAGLILVGVSINLSKVLAYPGVPDRALEALVILLGVVLVSTVALAPNLPNRTLGMALAVIGIAVWLVPTVLQIRVLLRRPTQPWWWLVQCAILCQLATVPFWVAGLSLVLGFPQGLYWLIPGCVFAFVASVASAWILLVEIVR
jgi:hypothetical protein